MHIHVGARKLNHRKRGVGCEWAMASRGASCVLGWQTGKEEKRASSLVQEKVDVKMIGSRRGRRNFDKIRSTKAGAAGRGGERGGGRDKCASLGFLNRLRYAALTATPSYDAPVFFWSVIIFIYIHIYKLSNAALTHGVGTCLRLPGKSLRRFHAAFALHWHGHAHGWMELKQDKGSEAGGMERKRGVKND